jgi:hypothetical protein
MLIHDRATLRRDVEQQGTMSVAGCRSPVGAAIRISLIFQSAASSLGGIYLSPTFSKSNHDQSGERDPSMDRTTRGSDSPVTHPRRMFSPVNS